MITVHVAERLDHLLRSRGRHWEPTAGDRFVIPGRDIDDVFVVADMTIEVEHLPTGRLVRFNGTTEWALDSIPAEEVLWLPWEHQLRTLLGPAFASLTRDGDRFVVALADGSAFADEDVESAYAAALLAGDPLRG